MRNVLVSLGRLWRPSFIGLSVLALAGCCCGQPMTTSPVVPRAPIADRPLTRIVFARPYWNDTGLTVERGVRYHFSADGQWCDAGISSSAAGYSSPNFIMRWAEGWRRAPQENWFALICAVDRDKSHLVAVLKEGGDHSFPASGELSCFANDAPLFYWNNSGTVMMTVRRVERQ